ncbi:MAG: YihY family inner membrane protein [Desulfobacteraceae bacterium]|nr:MAG: YihY family inner membrane protein [Desulfobacteraceae bacterium]
MISKMRQYFKEDVWRIRSGDLPRHRSFLVRLIRIGILSIRGLTQDRCHLRASALTFYSLLSVVPVLATLFGIAKGFGLEEALQKHLMENLMGQEEVLARIIDFAHALLENTKGGLVAGVGVAILFYSIIKVFGQIESSFNDIWGVPKGRPLIRKITDYLSLMLICPVIFISSSAITVVARSQAEVVINKIAFLEAFSPALLVLLKIFPFAALWALFTFIYIFIPNTGVRFRSAVLAGIIAGTVFHLFQGAYVMFQVNMTRYNAIYGSFAALPLFLMWLQISWLIVLFGAEISFSHQNVDTFEFEPDSRRASRDIMNLLSLRVTNLILQRFLEGKGSLQEEEIGKRLEIPARLLRRILHELNQAGIIVQLREENEKNASYQAGLDPEILTVGYVLKLLDCRGTSDIPVAQSKELERLRQSIDGIRDLIAGSEFNLKLKDV